MEPTEFETIVSNAIAAVPKKLRDRLENVVFVIEQFHRNPRGKEVPLQRGYVLLGLYQGIPYGARGSWYSGALPDKITIFQDTIEALGHNDPTEIQTIVQNTVEHEVAHYFGLDEKEVRGWEKGRKKTQTKKS